MKDFACGLPLGPFAASFASLLPPGDHLGWGDCLIAFRTPGDHEEWALMETLAARDKRIADRVCEALAAIRPADCGVEMLAAHEISYGLPDPCMGDLAVFPEARRDAILAKIRSQMRQRTEDFEAYAAAAGYDIAVETHPPTTIDRNTICDPIDGDEWWLHIVIKGVPIYDADICNHDICTPLGFFDVERVICLLQDVIGPQYVVTYSVSLI